MLSKVNTATVVGLDGVLVEVEVDVANRGFPTFTIVGLPNKAVDEAKDRVRTAIVNAGYEMPDSRITVNLAPADIPKVGSGFDLPIAIAILAASQIIDISNITESLFVGELSLEGKIRPTPGIISIALLAKSKNITNIFVPPENAIEADLIKGLTVYPVENLKQLLSHINSIEALKCYKNVQPHSLSLSNPYNFADIRGQESAKRLLEISAAGFHNVHLKGVPGAGKTLLSRSFSGILPPLDEDELLEVAKIYSAVGLLKETLFSRMRPFRAPHHTTSRIGLIGGGSNPTPGEISLAHRGVLFLDELPEFPRTVLESMRQPLEDGLVTVARAAGSLTFPCRFLLLAASNPCPCGYLGHPTKKCTCMPGAVIHYKKKLSGPLLDRIDLHLDIAPVEHDKLVSSTHVGESSDAIRDRVLKAHERQHKRFLSHNIKFNSEMSSAEIKKLCALSLDASDLLKQAILKLSLSARSYFKIIKSAQTIADIAGSDTIESIHIAEALQYRSKDQ